MVQRTPAVLNPANDAIAVPGLDPRHMTELDPDPDTGPKLGLVLFIALGLITVGGIIDLVLDRPDDWLAFHPIFESLMIAGALVLATALWLGWRRSELSLVELRVRLEARKAERDAWRKSARAALAGLAEALQTQFTAWHLTPSEREVAVLLLKGYSHKHVARLTGRSERTARQHAVAIYQKAGVASRAEFAAFFLDDLLLPPVEGNGRSPA